MPTKGSGRPAVRRTAYKWRTYTSVYPRICLGIRVCMHACCKRILSCERLSVLFSMSLPYVPILFIFHRPMYLIFHRPMYLSYLSIFPRYSFSLIRYKAGRMGDIVGLYEVDCSRTNGRAGAAGSMEYEDGDKDDDGDDDDDETEEERALIKSMFNIQLCMLFMDKCLNANMHAHVTYTYLFHYLFVDQTSVDLLPFPSVYRVR